MNYEHQPVSKGYPAAHAFMVYCTFYNFLFPLSGNNSVIMLILTGLRGMLPIKMQMQANRGETHYNANAHINLFQTII